MKDYSKYRSSWKWNRGPHIETKLTQDEGRAILAQGGVFLRNAYDFDYNIETAYWYIIKDSFNGIQDVPSKYRGYVRKSLEKYDFKIVPRTFALEECYEIYRVAAEHYRVKTTVPTKVEFEDISNSLDNTYDIWVAIDKVSGRVAGRWSAERLHADGQIVALDTESRQKVWRSQFLYVILQQIIDFCV